MNSRNDPADTPPQDPFSASGAAPRISAAERDFWRRAVEAERERLALGREPRASRSTRDRH